MDYTLVYHAGLPGRGEVRPLHPYHLIQLTNSSSQFVRLFFEATGTAYHDTAREVGQGAVWPYLKDGFKDCGEPLPLSLSDL